MAKRSEIIEVLDELRDAIQEIHDRLDSLEEDVSRLIRGDFEEEEDFDDEDEEED